MPIKLAVKVNVKLARKVRQFWRALDLDFPNVLYCLTMLFLFLFFSLNAASLPRLRGRLLYFDTCFLSFVCGTIHLMCISTL